MNKVLKAVLYTLISVLALTVLVALVMSFIPKFAPSADSLFKITDFIYLPIPIIGILVMILVIDKRTGDEASK